MRISKLRNYTASICAAAATLAGCGGQPPIAAPGAMPQASALAAHTTSANYKVVYAFGEAPTGATPPQD